MSARPTRPEVLGEQCGDEQCSLQLRVPAELAYFPGHFPRAPVLPGAAQVGWALQLAAEHLGTPIPCRTMEALKFQRLLQPGDRVTLTLRLDRARGKLHFAYAQGELACSSGRLVLEPPA